MAYETEARMRCDQCQDSSEAFDCALYTKTQILQMLREAGWSRRRGGRLYDAGDVCPNCNPNARKAAA